MSVINNNIKNLSDSDIYSLIMFALYNMKNEPKYSTLSELAYVLDKNNLLKLCEYFGGITITIPTIDEIQDMLQVLLIYQLVDIEHNDIDDVLKDMHITETNKVKSDYIKLHNILDKYEFGSSKIN